MNLKNEIMRLMDEQTEKIPAPVKKQNMDEDPKEALDPTVVDNMGSKEKFATPDPQATWDAVTKGATHKITACMQNMKGKVSDEGAFCKWLADKVGYKPE